MNKFLFSVAFLISCFPALSQQNGVEQRQKEYLKQLLPLLRPPRDNAASVTLEDKTWFDWQKRTGELPPDFQNMPSIPFLPDPLILQEGTTNIPIQSPEQWDQKKDWIKNQIQHWLTGTFPEAPTNLSSTILEEHIEPNGVKVQMVELTFGPEERGRLTVELLIPPGKGPHPVFMTQWNHRGWAEIAVRRGYIGVVYAGADSKDDTDAYASLYPEYDFTTLMRRAWGAMRAVDYLYTLQEVDKSKIAIAGHSRNGKQALMAAAFDERFAAVIPSSGGTAGENSFRFTDDRFDNESLDEISANFPHWLHPRLRFFHGREHKLPVDQNLLMSLIAPRGLLLSSAITEGQGSPWGIEQNYHSLANVYDFLGEKDKLAIRLRQGRHGTLARDIEAFMDFLDYIFERGSVRPENQLFYDYTFQKWKEASGENINPMEFPPHQSGLAIDGQETDKKLVKEKLSWLLGEEPPGAKAAGPFGLKRQALSDDFLGEVIQREKVAHGERVTIGPYNALADYQFAYLYIPKAIDVKTKNEGKIPVVIYIHEYAYSTGFGRRSADFIERYLKAGIAVMTMDMIGFGSRIEEGTLFYQRYPHWSKMGKMTADIKAAVDAIQDFDILDQLNIYLSGYALGGTAALLAAAQDDRIAGVAVSSGFTPLRFASEHVEGLKSYSHWHGLMPRLGFFEDHPQRLPVDFADIIAVLAPRPVLILAPELDRHADLEQLKAAMNLVQQYYDRKASDNLTVKYPMEVNRFTDEQQQDMVDWTIRQVTRKIQIQIDNENS
jgi:cephalosporin-C deacetylase-like acetyl esterase